MLFLLTFLPTVTNIGLFIRRRCCIEAFEILDCAPFWKEHFLEFLFPVHCSNVDFSTANFIKAVNIPDRLFKYRRFDEDGRALQCLEKDQLFCVKAALLNDPYECTVHFAEDTFTELIEEDLEGSYCDHNAQHLYICSFSELGDSSLMWSHYAEDHKGFCIEYNFAECPHMLCWQFLYPVLYQEEMADLSDYHRNPYDLNFLMDKLTAMIKSSQWAYEKEWRMIMPFDIGNIPAVPMPMPQPKAVYAGCRTAEENLEKLMRITQAKGIPLYQMVKDAHSYNFQCQPLSL